jgi:hypothetical protein
VNMRMDESRPSVKQTDDIRHPPRPMRCKPASIDHPPKLTAQAIFLIRSASLASLLRHRSEQIGDDEHTWYRGGGFCGHGFKLDCRWMRGDERDVNTQGEDNHLTASRPCRVLTDQWVPTLSALAAADYAGVGPWLLDGFTSRRRTRDLLVDVGTGHGTPDRREWTFGKTGLMHLDFSVGLLRHSANKNQHQGIHRDEGVEH